MSLALQSPPSATVSSPSPSPSPSPSSSSFFQKSLRFSAGSRAFSLIFGSRRPFPVLRASSGSSSSLVTGVTTELDAVSSFSEIVPDTVVFDDFENFPPTAGTVSSSLLLGICGLPDTIFRNAIDMALADPQCFGIEHSELKLSCIFNKALVNVGGELVKLVPGRVSTEVDARVAYDTHGIIRKIILCGFDIKALYICVGDGEVHDLLKLYNEINVPPERLLFKIPSTWQGIEASRLLESEGIQTHLTFVYSFAQAAAAAQAGASVIQIFIGRIRDWARNHSGDPEIEAALRKGEDPGLALVKKAYNYIHKYGYKSKLMGAAVRNKQDLFSLLGVDYIIAPLKVLQSLKESPTTPDDKYSFVRRLSPQSAANYDFSEEEVKKWDQLSLASGMGPAAVQLLASGLEGNADQGKRVEELLEKIWPPPNV